MGGKLEMVLAAHGGMALAGYCPIGLPELSLGVLAAGGEFSRTVEMRCLVTALECVLLSGRSYSPAEVLKVGLFDDVVADPVDLVPRALAWLDQAAGDPQAAIQPWDRPSNEVADHLLSAVSIGAVAASQDGSVASAAEANVRSIDGDGFPAVLGGPIGHVVQVCVTAPGSASTDSSGARARCQPFMVPVQALPVPGDVSHASRSKRGFTL